jgi:hypothetical protein
MRRPASSNKDGLMPRRAIRKWRRLSKLAITQHLLSGRMDFSIRVYVLDDATIVFARH